ncbi:MAG TPA: papain-like cysteine protease family protein [Bryobacteraceae bacterium]|nr:papain-like cysteine protease family protein [Bryobacteraceae bacterium]
MADPFEIVKQTGDNWCWAAVGATISRYFRPDLAMTECDVATHVLGPNCCQAVPPPGTDVPAALQDVLSIQEIDALQDTMAGEVLEFDRLRKQIVDASLPVCVRIGWSGENRGHFVIICGCPISPSGEQWVDIVDPFFPDSVIRYDHFVSSYQDAGEWTDTFLLREPR